MGKSSIPLKLAARGIRFRCLKALGLPGKPEALSMEVTRHCVAKCIMCNIWKMVPTSPELEAADWLQLLESPFLSELKELDVTGGEPFLRKDITDLLLGIGRLKGSNLGKLCSVAITTNGFLTEKVLKDVGSVIGPLEGAGVTLVFACGFDAVGEVHDTIRNVKGGWEKLNATLEGLCRLRDRYPRLVLGIKNTVTRYNIDELDKVCAYADDHGLFTIISPYIVTSNRYDNIGKEDYLSFSPEDLGKLKSFYNSDRFRWSYYRDELLHFLDTGRMGKPCSAGFNYFFIRSTGEFYCCPIIDHLLGNVKEMNLEHLIRSPKAAEFRKKILEFPECSVCTEPGLERYALPFEGFHYLRQYFRLGGEGFRELHKHMGLNKYFEGTYKDKGHATRRRGDRGEPKP
jgi:MoaA/NifB/PqqE/SkfB family radical SAM enzyme